MSLCNAIERAFNVLKKRFPIIANTTKPTYCIGTENEIILLCCTLQNYLIGVDPYESLVVEFDEEVVTFPSWTCSPSSKRRWQECLTRRYYKRFYSISHVAKLCPNVITFGFIVVILFKTVMFQSLKT